MKFSRVGNEEGKRLFNCPGCKMAHAIYVSQSDKLDKHPIWKYNGDEDSPTITPSVLAKYKSWNKEIDGVIDQVCHSFITNGEIRFLNDCTHELAGKTVELEDWEEMNE